MIPSLTPCELTTASSTIGVAITRRTSENVSVCAPRRTVSLTRVPAFPRIDETPVAEPIDVMCRPLTAVITSPTCIPAPEAGDRGSTPDTSSPVCTGETSIPTPENCCGEGLLNELNACGVWYCA